MIQLLSKEGYIFTDKYAEISLSEKGRNAGTYLLHRHDVLHRLLCLVNGTDFELEQTEKIEHFLEQRMIEKLMERQERAV